MSGDLLIYGDPHGEFGPLLRACLEDPPTAIIILGDCDLARPLREQIAPVFDKGIRVRWIPGNHDADSVEWHDRLFGDYPEGSLHGRTADLAGMRVGGIGGVFQDSDWAPEVGAAAPRHATRQSLLRSLPPSGRWRGGIPLRLRAVIFPEDITALDDECVDVLCTHEAPTTHPLGSAGIDQAASACRARMVVHGHHHQSCVGKLPGGTAVRGLARAEVFRLRRSDLPVRLPSSPKADAC